MWSNPNLVGPINQFRTLFNTGIRKEDINNIIKVVIYFLEMLRRVGALSSKKAVTTLNLSSISKEKF